MSGSRLITQTLPKSPKSPYSLQHCSTTLPVGSGWNIGGGGGWEREGRSRVEVGIGGAMFGGGGAMLRTVAME